MIFREKENGNNGWCSILYTATWGYGWDFMLDAGQALIDIDWKTGLDEVAWSQIAQTAPIDITDEVKKCGGRLRDVEDLKTEHGVLTLAGRSSIMGVNFQIDFYSQTQLVRVFIPEDYIKEHGSHVLDNYMNSIEIKAYCTSTERRVRDEIKG